MATKGTILGIGNPLLDISADVKPELLTKYDLQPSNAILAEEKHFPLYDELVKDYKVKYIAGGSTQNTIRVAQWFLQDVPNATTFLGCIGNDKNGEQLKKELEVESVNQQYLIDAKEPTGTCAVLVTDKERSLVTKLGAANHYKIEHLEKKEIWQSVENAKIFFISGFFLTVSTESALKIAKHAAEKDKVFSMSLAAPFICEFYNKQLDQLLPYMDYVFANEHEAVAFGKKYGYGESQEDIIEIAKKLAEYPKENKKRPRTVVFTQGPLPVIVVRDGVIKQYNILSIKHSEIVDLNGAGDAFVGGFIAQLAKGKSLQEAMKAARYAANVIIRHSGCTFPKKPEDYNSKFK